MGDQLEKFIHENRAAFDDATPSENTWAEINNRMEKRKFSWTIVWKVAALLFLASTLYLMIDRPSSTEHEGPVLSEEFLQAEDYYTQLISEKREIIQKELTPEQQKEFLIEIDQLDTMYEELKKNHKTNAANERVVDAMITNLQLRLEILTRQLDILENIKAKSNDERISIEI